MGWTFWTWKRYDDPAGSLDEALAAPDGALGPTALALAQAYPEAIAGTPLVTTFDQHGARFRLVYAAQRDAVAPTVIVVPPARCTAGYCVAATGADVVSAPGDAHLALRNRPGARVVSVTVTPGRCGEERRPVEDA